ncbi:NRDE family protein [Bacillus sp. FJAT-42315]|uniref:NRDE family protein n=1 Tax=Bacillus sp. FJAT-42315 TaxID=2014077 RepID=UPI000C23C20A|nr:NRDE family protein [Bacillus sp. FJAT-42315]
MCLINFQFQQHPNYKLIVAANRDEFFARPTKRAHFWEDEPQILAGRDLEKMGTWLGVTTSGRFAALTNFRDPTESTEGKWSRGDIVRSFLSGQMEAELFLQRLSEEKAYYPSFNVIVGTADLLWYYNNRQDEITKMVPGIHSLSNAFLNTPWPKTERGKQSLQSCVHNKIVADANCLFASLQSEEQMADEELPQTGVSLQWERLLSSMFINSEQYGTRSSTVLTIDRNDRVQFIERTYTNGRWTAEEQFHFVIEKK